MSVKSACKRQYYVVPFVLPSSNERISFSNHFSKSRILYCKTIVYDYRVIQIQESSAWETRVARIGEVHNVLVAFQAVCVASEMRIGKNALNEYELIPYLANSTLFQILESCFFKKIYAFFK